MTPARARITIKRNVWHLLRELTFRVCNGKKGLKRETNEISTTVGLRKANGFLCRSTHLLIIEMRSFMTFFESTARGNLSPLVVGLISARAHSSCSQCWHFLFEVENSVESFAPKDPLNISQLSGFGFFPRKFQLMSFLCFSRPQLLWNFSFEKMALI